MLNDSGAKVLLAGGRYADQVRSHASDLDSVETFVALDTKVEGWLSYDEMLSRASSEERFPEGDGDDITLILFTAGTTGEPKGVMLSHESFSSYVLANVTPADPEEAGRNILTVPLYHIAAVQRSCRPSTAAGPWWSKNSSSRSSGCSWSSESGPAGR